MEKSSYNRETNVQTILYDVLKILVVIKFGVPVSLLYKETSLPGIQLMVWWEATSAGSHCGSVLIPVQRDSVPPWIPSDAVRQQAMINHQPTEYNNTAYS